jgi:hypothetical protein
MDWNVNAVPQALQKVRVPCADDLKLAGDPDVNRNLSTGTVNQATNGAPLTRRQIEQWQFVSSEGAPVTS